MTGKVRGLHGRVMMVNPEIKWNHCIIHREALASKRMSPELSAVMDDAVKVLNYIQSRPMNHRLFQSLCQDSGAKHDQLLLHTDVRWLSRGKTLRRLFEFRIEVSAFLKEHLHPLAVVFENPGWNARLAYLADVFSKLNELNLSLQGKDAHILNMYDKVNGFIHKVTLWEKKCDDGDVSCFTHLATTDAEKNPLVKIMSTHLSKLKTDFNQYFHDIEEKSEHLDWVRNPFRGTESSSSLPARLQENLVDLSFDRVQKTFQHMLKSH